MLTNLDKIFIKWFADRGYKTIWLGPGHVHIYNPDKPNSFPHWDIDYEHEHGRICTTSRHGVKYFYMSDPDMFIKLGEIFPTYKVSFYVKLKNFISFIKFGV